MIWPEIPRPPHTGSAQGLLGSYAPTSHETKDNFSNPRFDPRKVFFSIRTQTGYTPLSNV